MLCSAGKREFQRGRYLCAETRNGYQFLDAFERFRTEVEDHKKVGFLAVVPAPGRRFVNAAAELRFLGEIMVDAGFAESAGALIAGQTIAAPIEMRCPVTGLATVYEFFPVAFTTHGANVSDPLYDPALSAPFLAINTTSDAFAFGMLVKDLSQRQFGCQPFEIGDRAEVERLFDRCVSAWHNMSVNTITAYGRLSAVPSRAVRLSDDRMSWFAPHNDPVFAELVKEQHGHEMPVVYAARLCEKWLATLFEGARYLPSRDGQSGGVPTFHSADIGDELHGF
ncbi:hypothetical protein [Prosthecomicrobium pneumaticum]|uniref:Uncharacterized protein n=1 Tax=Prosthecomicrobium pneumaticum TaxID=81895 RepID=A0A7W9L3A6_9HYPH|nr:hypothetical protein [Prosthecomicrobium pneumaticum]MBB5754299.1 hypothetical protein [Prosthecomicrobium pneumaticum]